MKEVKRIKLNTEILDFVEAKFEDYKAKQDLLTMIFELHKGDDDDTIIKSAPFKSYEKEFAKAKVEYDTAMNEISNKYVPVEYKSSNYSFELNFSEMEMIISEV